MCIFPDGCLAWIVPVKKSRHERMSCSRRRKRGWINPAGNSRCISTCSLRFPRKGRAQRIPSARCRPGSPARSVGFFEPARRLLPSPAGYGFRELLKRKNAVRCGTIRFIEEAGRNFPLSEILRDAGSAAVFVIRRVKRALRVRAGAERTQILHFSPSHRVIRNGPPRRLRTPRRSSGCFRLFSVKTRDATAPPRGTGATAYTELR